MISAPKEHDKSIKASYTIKRRGWLLCYVNTILYRRCLDNTPEPIIKQLEIIWCQSVCLCCVHTQQWYVTVHHGYKRVGAWRSHDVVTLGEHEQVFHSVAAQQIDMCVRSVYQGAELVSSNLWVIGGQIYLNLLPLHHLCEGINVCGISLIAIEVLTTLKVFVVTTADVHAQSDPVVAWLRFALAHALRHCSGVLAVNSEEVANLTAVFQE